MKFISLNLDMFTDSWWQSALSNEDGNIFYLCVKTNRKENTDAIQTWYPELLKYPYVSFEGFEYKVIAPIYKKANVKDGQKLLKKNLFFQQVNALSETPRKFSEIDKYLFNRPAWVDSVIHVKQKVKVIV